jgi:hypothetical protein
MLYALPIPVFAREATGSPIPSPEDGIPIDINHWFRDCIRFTVVGYRQVACLMGVVVIDNEETSWRELRVQIDT